MSNQEFPNTDFEFHGNQQDKFSGSKGFTYSLEEGEKPDKEYGQTIRKFVDGLYDKNGNLTELGKNMEVTLDVESLPFVANSKWQLTKIEEERYAYLGLVDKETRVEIKVPIDKIREIEIAPQN